MASKPQGSSKRVLPWQVTMGQLICTSLSHIHYWYEVGMLKVPAVWTACVSTLVQHLEPSGCQSRSWSAEQRNYFPYPRSRLKICLEKNLNASKPSAYLSNRRGMFVNTFWWENSLGCKDKNSSWHSIVSPDGSKIGSALYVREKTTVIMYTYNNRYAGTPKQEQKTQ